MRIALFTATADRTNGYGNITYELSRHLHSLGNEVVLFVPRNEAKFVVEWNLPFEIRCVLPKNVFRLYQKEGWKYFRTIDVSGFDIVHSLFSFPFCIPAMRSARKYRKPFMMGAQGTYGVRPLTQFPERWFLKQCYRRAAAIAVPSMYTKEKICEYAGERYPITVIHNGVDYARFSRPVDTRKVREQYGNKKILLTVGGLKERKGQDLVLQALQQIRSRRNDVVYVLVGEGNWKQGLQRMAADLGVGDAVHFVGNKTGDELVAYFQACDLYVHTPKVVDLNFEGFGIVYLEAGACGKPSVATDAGGVRDAVVHGETGVVINDGDVTGIASAVLDLLDHPDRIATLGSAARQYAEKHDWALIAKSFMDLYVRNACVQCASQ
ncbi:glycosyltransferase family 4 protein [Candidatus Peregrinibacteria bacterium]|nr:glycosyltransferase family 4 protein [Candidatus Peregrinibacteria bacterium]